MTGPFIKLYHGYLYITRGLPRTPRNLLTTVLFLCAACVISGELLRHTGGENNSDLVFILAIMCISLLTDGYVYGIAASVVGALCINYFFMFPFRAFSLSISGYPVTMLSMVAISAVICALTGRIKAQAIEATRREQGTKALYELNAKLNAEKAAIQLQADRETIRGNILRAVSHDLRTPLTAISGAASVLLSSEEIASSERSASLVRDIKSDADALSAMVENLLSITKIRDGVMPLNKQEEMLEEVAGDALLTMRRRFPDCPIALELSDDILYLPMEPMLIKQVIVNLLENAIRHSGDREHIRLRLFRQEDWAVVEVRDRGRGISPEVSQAVQLGRPLEDNLSGDSSRGMGIGLSVCQSIIKAHDGFFAAGNDPEGGAVFRFGLPMEEIKDE